MTGIRRLFHCHDWQCCDVVKIYAPYPKTRHYFVYYCPKCGEVKIKENKVFQGDKIKISHMTNEQITE